MDENEELAFWTTVDWPSSDVPHWQPIVMQQMLEEASSRFATDWSLPDDDRLVA